MKDDKSMFILSDFMFMELIKLNKFILNIKFINIQWEVAPDNLLISFSHMTWKWTF